MSEFSEPPRSSWLGRNWVWLLPVGGGLLAIVILCGGFALFVTSMLGTVMGVLKSADPYKDGLARAQNSPAVTRALGQPIQPSYWVNGNISMNNGSGTADLSTTLTGPNGTGTLHVVGAKNAGKWTYSTLEVQLPGQASIDLLKEGPAPPGGGPN
jgi:hypothetical protein